VFLEKVMHIDRTKPPGNPVSTKWGLTRNVYMILWIYV
jgi:hypothetical protein